MSLGKLIIDICYALGLFVNAVVFLLQARKIYRVRSSSQVSLVTFVGFNVVQLFGILNGIAFADPDLMYGLIPSFVTCQVLIWTIVYFRRR